MKVRKKGIELSNNAILDVLEKISVSYCKLKNSEHEFELVNEMDN